MRNSSDTFYPTDLGLLSPIPTWYDRLFAIRLEGLLASFLFLFESSQTWISQSSLLLVVIVLVGAAVVARRFGARANHADSVTASSAASQRWALCLVGGILSSCGLVIHSSGITMFGTTALLAGLLSTKWRALANQIAERFRAGLCVVLLSLLSLRFITLGPSAWFTPLLYMCEWGNWLAPVAEPPSHIGDLMVFSGTEVHVSYLLGYWAFVPILYALCVQKERYSRKCLKAVFAASVTWFCIYSFVSYSVSKGYSELLLSRFANTLELLIGYCISLAFWPPTADSSRNASVPLFPTPILLPLVVSACLSVMPLGRGAEGVRILIDEAHGRWETADGTFDESSYGRDTVYNYKLMKEWLEAQWSVRTETQHLADIKENVLIVKMPTEFYSESEKIVVQTFVRDGGTLLVIGDHTNLFGSSLIINDLLAWTGMQLNFDAVIPVSGPHLDLTPRWWNPVASDPSLKRIEFQTSASISAHSPWVRPLITTDNALAERADYSNDRFFGDLIASADDRRGPLCLCAERCYGSGRVVLFGDSTIWSNFSFYAATNERLFASLFRDRPKIIGVAGVSVAYILTCIVLVLVVSRLSHRPVRLVIGDYAYWCVALLSVALVVSWTCRSTIFGDAPTLPYEGLERVALDTGNSHVSLRADVRKGTDDDLHDYSTFYAWLSRGGRHPLCVDDHRYDEVRIPTMIVNPTSRIPYQTAEGILDYLRNGGRLLFLFDPAITETDVVGEFLQRFDVRVEPVRIGAEYFDANGPDLNSNLLSLPFDILTNTHASRGARRVEAGDVRYALAGVTPLLVDSSGIVVAGEKMIGKGKLTIFSRSIVFSEFVFGDVWGGKEPSDEKLNIYRFADDLVTHAFSD